MPRYRLTIEYDGTGYVGWQRQDHAMSIQQALEEAFEQFVRHPVRIFAAGRTDAGVHATGQVAHVDLDAAWDVLKIREAANGILRQNGHAIAVLECEAVGDAFEARFSAVRRTYRYRIVNRRAPLTLERNRAWWVLVPLDAEAMHQAARHLVGHHDFTTFRSTECQAKSPMRTLDALDVIRRDGDHIDIVTHSRSFLHSQVRSMVGSLKRVGEGKWSAEDLRAALEACDRAACGPIAPPDGLYLERVDY